MNPGLRAIAVNVFRLLFIILMVGLCFLTITPSKVEAAPTITTTSLPSGQVNVSYLAQISATCTGTCTWSYTGSLPAGLVFAGGFIQGTPTAVGASAIQVTVSDSSGSSSQSFIITITAPALTFTGTSLPAATTGQVYSASITASGGSGTITYSMTSGNLPSGLTFNGGSISGTPARGTEGNYTFTVTATSGTTTAQQSLTLTVQKGTFNATVFISSGLAQGQTQVYVNNASRGSFRGGDSIKLTGLDPDSATSVSVDSVVADPTRSDIRYKAESDSASLTEDNNQIRFDYYPEYNISLASDPPDAAPVSGSGWYKEGVPINATAPQSVDKDSGTQYHFSYWLAPGGDRIASSVLNASVSQPGKYIATYELYYRLSIVSRYGHTQGDGWYKNGSIATWNVDPPEIAMPDLLGFFGGKFKALVTTGTETMDGPKSVTITWNPDYVVPTITITMTLLIIAGLIWGIYSLAKRSSRPMAAPYFPPIQTMPPPPVYPPFPVYIPPPPPIQPPPQPAMPPPQTTVVMIGEGLKKPSQSTREQLMEKFGELLQKYEDELSTGRELPASTEIAEIPAITSPDKKSLPAPEIISGDVSEEKAVTKAEECGFATKKLLRTVVTQWRNTNIKPITVTPGDKKSAALAGGRTVTWTRDTYNEWELHVCKLPAGHKGTHKGATETVYSLLETINEDRNYGQKQPLKPPVPHYTDGMPEVNIPASQIVPPDQLPA